MSIEYTLDIQLTEMGFPDIVQPQEASVAETPPNSSSPSNTSSSLNCTAPKSLPGQRVHKRPGKTKKACGKKAKRAKEDTEEDSDSDVSYMEEEIEDEDELYDEEEDEEEEEEDGADGNFQCNVCNLQFTTNFKLQDHMNLHTGARPYSCAECGKRFSQIRNYRDHLRAHARYRAKQPKCRICLKRFRNETELKYHLTMNHFEDKFYECDRCKRVFTNMESCQHHVEFTCMRKVKCEKCGLFFPKEKQLKRHLESKTCNSKLKCSDCPKIFTKKNALLKHSFSHLGLLPYTCVRCKCHFRLARLYLRHECKPQRIHCVACLREFLNDQDFQQHKKDTGCWGNHDQAGDEVRCLECGLRFDTKEDLKKHAGAHQRVLKCAECGKGFRSALLLMSHMGGHAGQSPCLCQSCGLGFPHQQSYDSHLKTCGQESPPSKMSKKSNSMKKSQHTSTSRNSPSEMSKLPIPALKKKVTSSSSPLNSTTSTGPVAPVASLSKQAESNEIAARSVSAVTTTPDSSASSFEAVTRPLSSSASPSLPTIGQDSSPVNPVQTEDPNDPSKGCWKLSLDKPPPPGVNLLLLLPVGQPQTTNLLVPCAVPQVVTVPEIQVQTTLAINGIVGGAPVSTASKAVCKQELNPAPLDLSNKSLAKSSQEVAPTVPIKSEAEEMEVSGFVESTEEKPEIDPPKPLTDLPNIPALVKRRPAEESEDQTRKRIKVEADCDIKTE